MEFMGFPLDSNDPALVEALASNAHDQWSGWMEYLFRMSVVSPDGTVTIPANFVARWSLQSRTIYEDLPEDQKESDRIEARRVIGVLNNEFGRRKLAATGRLGKEDQP